MEIPRALWLLSSVYSLKACSKAKKSKCLVVFKLKEAKIFNIIINSYWAVTLNMAEGILRSV